jgi:hypothetical protein
LGRRLRRPRTGKGASGDGRWRRLWSTARVRVKDPCVGRGLALGGAVLSLNGETWSGCETSGDTDRDPRAQVAGVPHSGQRVGVARRS